MRFVAHRILLGLKPDLHLGAQGISMHQHQTQTEPLSTAALSLADRTPLQDRNDYAPYLRQLLNTHSGRGGDK